MADIERNTPVKFQDQIAYSESGVKFETICETKHGMAVLISLKNGAMLDTHSVDAMAIPTVIEGEVNFIVEGSDHAMAQGDSIVLAPNTVHKVVAKSDAKIYLVKINA